MSSWSEIRARSGDPLSDSIADLVSRANMSEAITDQITISDKISHVKILRSKIGITDKGLFSAYSRPRNPDQKYYMPFEPDGDKVRLDIKYDSGGEVLTDYAYQGNEAEIGYDSEQPTLYKNPEDDGITPGELCSILDGQQHFYRVPKTDQNSLKKMVETGEDGFSITCRVWFITVTNESISGGDSRATLFYFIENDQVEYAIKGFVDDSAYFHVYLKMGNDYYYAKSSSALFTPTDLSDFDVDNFNPENFDTGITYVPIPEVVPFTDFTVTFDFTTKELLIYKDGVLNSAEQYHEPILGDIHPIAEIPDLCMWVPLDDGAWGTTSPDDIGPNNLTLAAVNAGNTGSWNADNTFTNTYASFDGTYFEVPDHASMRNITEVTICMWVKKGALVDRGVPYSLFGKGQWTAEDGAIELGYHDNYGGFNYLYFGIYPGGNYHQAVYSNVPIVGNFVFITARWKSGEPIKISVNNANQQQTGWTVEGSMPLNLLGWIHGDKSNDFTIAHAMFYRRQLSDSEVTTIYNSFSLQNGVPQLPHPTVFLPINEGRGNTLNDIGPNGLTATIGYPDRCQWQTADKTLLLNGAGSTDGANIEVPNHVAFNKFNEMTLCFCYKPITNNAALNRLFMLGYDNSAHVKIHRSANTNDLRFSIGLNADGSGSNQVEFDNAFPTLNQWYFVVCQWKSGEPIRIIINNGTPMVDGTNTTGTFTELTRPLELVDWKEDNGIIANLIFFKRKLAAAELTNLYNAFLPKMNLIATVKPNFPIPFDDPEEPDPPGTPTQEPFVNVMNHTTETAQVKINKVTTSNFTEIYNVAGGTPVTDPFTPKYQVPEGTGSDITNPYATPPFYSMAGVSSTGNIAFADDETAAGQYINLSGSALNGKKVTRVSFELNGLGNPTGGNIFLGIIKADGSTIKFGAGIPVGDIPDAWTSYQRTGNQVIATQYTLVVGDCVGIIWEGGTGGAVNIRRTGSFNHQTSEDNGNNSCQNHYVTGDGWQTPNEEWAMASVMETGGEVVSSSPWITMDKTNQLIIGEQFHSSSIMYNNAPSKLEFKVYKKTGTTGTLYLQIITAAGAVKTNGTLKTWDIATELSDTAPAAGVYNITWENVLNTVTVGSGERICLVTPASGTGTMNTGGELYVMSNSGNNAGANDYNSTSSYIVKRNSAGTWATYNTALDISGNIWIGGNDFTGYIHLNDIRKRTGIKADTATSSFVTPEPGKIVTQVTITAKDFGTPAVAAIYCKIRSSTGVLKATIGQRDSSEVLGTDTSLTFTNVDNVYPMDTDDQVSIEYDGGTATDYIMIRINKNAFETTNTILFESFATDIMASPPVTDRDLAAIVYTGGQVDTAARPRRGIKVKANSSLIGDPITEARIKVKRTGSFGAGELMSVKVIRGSDKVTVATLATKELNTIDNTNFVEYTFQNTGNSYAMEAEDYIVIENNYGNSTTNFIEVKISSTNTFDGGNTVMFEWNGTTYTEIPTPDLTAQLLIGGFMIFPDPNIPTDPTPFHYFHGWIFGAATMPDSEALVKPETLKPLDNSFCHCFAKQTRLFAMPLTAQQITNYYENRFTTSAISKGEIEIVGNDISGYDT